MSDSWRSRTGPLAILGGVLWLLLVAIGLLAVGFDFDPTVGLWGLLFSGLVLATMLLILGTTLGLLTLDHTRVGRMGLKLFAVAAVVAAMFPPLTMAGQGDWAWRLVPIAYIMAFVGWMAFAVPNLRSQALPRWNRLPLLIGLIPVAGAVLLELSDWVLAIGAGLFGVAWLLLGYAVRSSDGMTAGATNERPWA